MPYYRCLNSWDVYCTLNQLNWWYYSHVTGHQNYRLVALLPPANEVWGKVIFSKASVKNSVHRGGASSGGWGFHLGGGFFLRRGFLLGGASSRGVLPPGGAWWRLPPETATAAGSTHPTGMHSCLGNVTRQWRIQFGALWTSPRSKVFHFHAVFGKHFAN